MICPVSANLPEPIHGILASITGPLPFQRIPAKVLKDKERRVNDH